MALSYSNGKRLAVIGGYNAEAILDDIWSLDLEALEWSRVPVDGRSPPPRAFFRGAELRVFHYGTHGGIASHAAVPGTGVLPML